MKDYTIGHSEFSDKVSIVESNDPAHADVINTPIKQLFGNTVANKRAVEESKEQVESKLQTFKNEISESQTELNKSLEKSMNDIKESNAALGKAIKDIADNSELQEILQHLADYKMYGEKSYAFIHKDILHRIYETVEVSMNDLKISGETLEYFIKENKRVGQTFAAVYGIEHREVLEKLPTLEAVIGSEAAMTAVANSSTAMTVVVNSSTAMTAVLNSSTAMTAVLNSSTAMTVVVNSSTAMTAVLNSSTAMTAVVNSSTAMTAVANSSTAMTVVANSSTAMTAVLNSSKCMLLKDTGLPGAEGGTCYGKFLLVGSTTLNPCVDNCIPDYKSQIQTQYKLILSTTKFGTVYTKIGVPGVPVTTIFTMLDDFSSGLDCVVYKL